MIHYIYYITFYDCLIGFITIPWNSDFIKFGQTMGLTVELDNPIYIGPRHFTISLGFFMVVSPGTLGSRR